MLMHTPPHPGSMIKRQCLEPLGLTITAAAKGLGVSRNTLSMLLNGRLGISPEMAVRLSQGFGGSAESRLRQQMQYDLQQVRRRGKITVKKFEAAEGHYTFLTSHRVKCVRCPRPRCGAQPKT